MLRPAANQSVWGQMQRAVERPARRHAADRLSGSADLAGATPNRRFCKSLTPYQFSRSASMSATSVRYFLHFGPRWLPCMSAAPSRPPAPPERLQQASSPRGRPAKTSTVAELGAHWHSALPRFAASTSRTSVAASSGDSFDQSAVTVCAIEPVFSIVCLSPYFFESSLEARH